MLNRIKEYFYDRDGIFKFGILSSPLFLSALALKLSVSFFFASDFLVKLFSRFVNYYVTSGFQNPYDFFYTLRELIIFPYPKIMLWILAAPRFIFSPFLSSDYDFVSNWHIFIYRLPIILADIIIFLILVRWLKGKENKVLKYYWCSPILFYISYIHGQLDALPIMFLFVFLYFLFKEKFYWAFSFLALAISAKTGIAIALPFAIVYLILQKIEIKKIILLSLIPLSLFVVININYLFSPGFFELVLNNKEQMKIFDFNYKLSDNFVIYFIPLAYLILFIKSLTYKTFNRDIFLMFLGFSFGILTLFIPPMQGWYYWIIPFFIYFYIKQDNAPKITFVLLNIFYFGYFLVIKNSDFFEVFQFISKDIAVIPNLYHLLLGYGVNADKLVNVIFTLLQTTLLLNILWIYRKGIENNIQYKIKYQPYLIGLTGDSGSGKTTFASLIRDIFHETNTAMLGGDDMHKWERGHEMWDELTHLNPKANKLYTELKNALRLKNGDAIERSHYDHSAGKFTLPEKLKSKRVVIFEGLHSLFLNKMRNTLDLKIFVNPDDQIRLHWKVLRDIKERGYSKEKIIEQIEKRQNDSDKFIKSQEQYADISIYLKSKNSIKNIGNEKEIVDVYLEFKCANDVNLELLLDQLMKENLNVENLVYDDYQLFRIEGEINSEKISRIANKIIPELNEIIIEESKWESNHKGLIQLFICCYIFEKMRMEENDK